MALQYVGGQVGGRSGYALPTTVTFSLVGGLASTPAAGDVVFVCVATGSTTDLDMSVSGYTQVCDLYRNSTYDTNIGVAYKRMGETPDTSVTIPSTGSASNAQAWTIHVFRGVDPDTPLDVAYASSGGISSTAANPPAITPVTAGAWVYYAGAASHATLTSDYSAPANSAGWRYIRVGDDNDIQLGAAYYSGWTSGSYDPPLLGGGSLTGATHTSVTIGIRPAILPVGPLAATESGTDTFAASGSVLVSGELGVTEGTDIFASSGIVPASGVLAVVDAPDSFSAGGVVPAQGDLSAADQPDSVTSTGVVTVAGDLSVTDQSDSISSTGFVLVSGLLAVSDADDVAAIVGSVKGGDTQISQGHGGYGFLPEKKPRRDTDDDLLMCIMLQ